jgi:hypothetical protein
VTTDELDELLRDRFDLARSDLISALKTLPAQRRWAATLTQGEAELLDSAGFAEDPQAYAETAADVIEHMSRLYKTAYSAASVAKGLGVNDSRVRQRRLARTLWAIDDRGAWLFPALQFELVDNGDDQTTLKQIRGLDELLPRLLAEDLHPTAVAGFLLAPQSELRVSGQPQSVKDWLRHGGSTQPVFDLIDLGQWAVR